MFVKDLQEKIIKLKKEKDICILAHSYQAREITEVADIVGDSFMLSKLAAQQPNSTMLMCGVHFMAQTVKMLSPEKKVILANPMATCPMAEQIDLSLGQALRKKYPEHTIVAYINTTAELKTVCDVCVTSSSAVEIVRKIDNDKILFIPDCNLGNYVKQQVPEKQIDLVQGGCPVHASVRGDEARKAKELHPNALLLVHPECVPAVVEQADYVGSTSGIMNFAKKSDAKEFIIGTEMSIAEHLQYECPDKSFYVLSKKILCPNMKLTTLVDVYNSLTGKGGKEILLDDETIRKARVCIDEMIRLG